MIKRLFATTVLLLGITIMLCACGNTQNNSIDASEEIKDSSFFEEQGVSETTFYDGYFDVFFTPEEYVQLCKESEEKYSSYPQVAISDSVFVFEVNISDYNTNEQFYCIGDRDGALLHDYGQNSWPTESVRVGNYTFVLTQGNPTQFDIVDSNGIILRSIENLCNDWCTIEEVTTLGEGYVVFSLAKGGSCNLYLLNPEGDIYPISFVGNYSSLYYSSLEQLQRDISFGSIGDGLFSVMYVDGAEKVAYYCTTKGKKVIDLSEKLTNYSVTKLGVFSDGKATIEFVGADYKNYSVEINKDGEMLSEPSVL